VLIRRPFSTSDTECCQDGCLCTSLLAQISTGKKTFHGTKNYLPADVIRFKKSELLLLRCHMEFSQTGCFLLEVFHKTYFFIVQYFERKVLRVRVWVQVLSSSHIYTLGVIIGFRSSPPRKHSQEQVMINKQKTFSQDGTTRLYLI